MSPGGGTARAGATGLLAVLVGASLLTAAAAAPVLREPHTRLLGSGIDGRHHDPYTVMQQFAAARPLGIYTQPAVDAVGPPLAAAFGPVIAYNAMLLVTFPLAAATAFQLARRLEGSDAAGVVAAFVFAFSPFHLAQAEYHLHVAQIHWLPLYLLAVAAWAARPSPARGLLAAIAGLLVGLSSFYLGWIALVATPFALLCLAPAAPDRRRVLAAAAAGLVALFALPALAAAAAPGVFAADSPYAFPRSDVRLFSARPLAYVLPPVAHPLLGDLARAFWEARGDAGRLLEQQVSLGWGWLTLGVAGVWLWWRSGRPGSGLVPLALGMLALGVACSLPPGLRLGAAVLPAPAEALHAALPVFRAYARFGVLASLGVALLAGAGAAALWRRGVGARIAATALVVLGVFEYAPLPPRSRDVLPTRGHRAFAALPGAPRALDCASDSPAERTVAWLLGGRIELPRGELVDCYTEDLRERLVDAGLSHVLLRAGTPAWERRRAGEVLPGTAVVAEYEESALLRVTARRSLLRTAWTTGLDRRESAGVTSWRWMGARAELVVDNAVDARVEAALELEVRGFPGERVLRVELNLEEVAALRLGADRAWHRVAPLALRPGPNRLVLRPDTPPVVADAVLGNGDPRRLSVAVHAWRWRVLGHE